MGNDPAIPRTITNDDLRNEFIAWREQDDAAHTKITDGQSEMAGDIRVIKDKIEGLGNVVEMASAAATSASAAATSAVEAVTKFQAGQLSLTVVRESQTIIDETSKKETKRSISKSVLGFLLAAGGALVGWLTHGGLH